MSELYTIDRTPSTDLEKFQSLRIEALERELLKHKEFLAKIQEEFELHSLELAKGIEVKL